MAYVNLDFTALPAWHDIPGWFSLEKVVVLQQAIKQLSEGAVVVELGSYQGRSSVALAAVLPPKAKLICVDHFQGSEEHRTAGLDLSNLYQSFRANVARFGMTEQIHVLARKTAEAACDFADVSVDLLLLDAAHDYESVKADLTVWYPKLKTGAWLFCDDYDPVHWPGVVRAIGEFGLQGRTMVQTLWACRKQQN